ncbi:SpoIVB peptidase S55 [Terriglobus sp.]|uniref:SpoIVB peptidase S55 n=1 Tax=Terriglobus sp. TaxID=1889013 RepID=UPI003AFFD232
MAATVPVPAQSPVAIQSSTPAQTPASGPPLHADPFPLDQVRRGQHGTAWTVFEGRVPEPMDVEILGRMPNSIGPGQDMILARLHGTKPEFTGVVAGMSGSPVYIDGKLLGAISYRIGQFSKEPICGITPIGYMFQVRDLPKALTPTIPERPAFPAAPNEPAAAFAAAPGTNQNDALRPISTPLVFSGFTPDTLDRFGTNFRALGLEPVSGLGGASPETPQPEPIVPGSAVSAILARGDLNIAATCTVTYVDPKQLLACGHPITQYGDIALPMTKAEVLATLPSTQNAFKIVNTTETVGAFTEDRSNAIAGSFTATAPMIPVTVELAPVAGSGLPARTLHFQVLNNRDLTPQVLLAGVYQSLSGTNTAGNEMSLHLTGSVSIANNAPLRLDGTVSSGDGQPAAVQAAVLLAQRFGRVYANPLEQPVITGVTLRADVIPTRESAQIESARLSSDEARPGDTVTVEATIRPWQQPARVVELPLKLPTTLESGPIRVVVGDSSTMDRLTSPPPASAPHPLGLADTIAQLNRTHTNDRLYVALLDHETQGVTAAAALPSLPPDVVNTLQPLRDSREISFTSETAKEAGSVLLNAAVTGSQVLTLRIR